MPISFFESLQFQFRVDPHKVMPLYGWSVISFNSATSHDVFQLVDEKGGDYKIHFIHSEVKYVASFHVINITLIFLDNCKFLF